MLSHESTAPSNAAAVPPRPPAPAGYYALTGFCRYPATDIPGFDLGCYTAAEPTAACPLGANATSATLHAAAEACAATPGCQAFTSDGWLKATGLQSFTTPVEYLGGPWQGLYVKRPSTGSPLDAFCFYQSQDIFGNTLSRSAVLPDYAADGGNAEALAALCLATPGCLAFNTQQYLKRTADLSLLRRLTSVFPNPGQGTYVRATLSAREYALSSFCPYPGQDIVGFDIRCGLAAAQGGCARNRTVDRIQLLALAAACSATPACLAFTSEGWLKSVGAEALHPPPISYMTLPLQGVYVLRPRVVRYPTDWFCFYPGRDMPSAQLLLLLDEEEPDVGYPSFRNAQALAQVCLESPDCLAFSTATMFTSNGDVTQLVTNTTKFPGARDGTYIRAVLPARDNILGGSDNWAKGSYVDLGTNNGPVKQLSSASYGITVCALFESGKMKCWGSNNVGQLGLGDTVARRLPAQMGNALKYVDLGANTTVAQVSVGNGATCAVVQPGGRVKCWGGNANNHFLPIPNVQLGDQPGEMGDTLPAINLGRNATAMAVVTDGFTACAVLEPGNKIKCWGWPIDTSRPEQMGDNLPFVNLGSNITEITQLVMGAGFYCALLQPGGRVKCWGGGEYGALGNEAPNNIVPSGDTTPYVNLGTNVSVVQLAAGDGHVCALTDTGRLKCWGPIYGYERAYNVRYGNQPGDMGDNRGFIDLGPDVSRVIAVTTIRLGACALVEPGNRVKCWGPFVPDYSKNDVGNQPGEMGANTPVMDLRL
ncbi:hypothetical protein HYH02_014541 [Chlamydomonas schloesseri]|uniref:Uncharacterized protein n=1 Tax=Chlamydomonas schloesseri TaxID=2026947 RepID=A0A835SVT2_9CHLO|nr:hypothetical protein HYH02_014541 [Chlamydomonas schloesseri]|eukprot:KAG2427710.1 hypothetical protein HYH02_014541 [Chlamydomonas schloesseri]